ncbi:thioredoxin domain-containing protein 6-like isoform X2 [Tubulanus polymorphus]|uniref:thioredoxin domain-containing protein 6-like isoform X2 n=1 Tax=Tubulanus polymorphus TaxID=672921 RepID=UPI003DA1D7D0
MARKKQEVALQQELETQEEWEETLTKEGLIVIDVYQEWSGPCKGIVGNFKRLKNEVGDDLLRFAVAKADSIDALEHYRGKCEPCFLFYAGGSLVAVIRGANSPLLMRTITDQLAYEHKVLDGEAERKEIRDPVLQHLYEEKGKADEEENEKDEETVAKEVTVALIKPDAVSAGRVDDILAELAERGIEVLAHEERQLTDEEARDFYSNLAGEDYYESVVELMISGPSHVLVLTKGETGENVIQDFRDLLGPKNVEEAKETAPDSLRAKFGTDNYVNAVHGADSEDTVNKELAFFFPNFALPTVKKSAKPKVQRTLALIRPDALRENKDSIMEKIQEAGFEVAIQKEIQLTQEQAEEFYKEHKEQPYFEELVARMTSGPLMALGLAREDAITAWRDMLGPKEVDVAKENAPDSLRAQFAIDDVPINQLHGSDSEEAAKIELDYFFPMQQTVAVVKPDGYQTKDEIISRIKEAGFRVAAKKETELTKDIAEQFYGDIKEKEYFEDLTDHMCSGTTLFMVLSGENVVEGWRSIIGPTDPEEAKEKAPESLRAQFGSSIKENAVHGSSNPEHAKKNIHLIFGDVEFNDDEETKEEAAETEEDEGEQEIDEDAEEEPQKEEEQTEAEAAATDETTQEEQTEEQTEQKGSRSSSRSSKSSTKSRGKDSKSRSNSSKSVKEDEKGTKPPSPVSESSAKPDEQEATDETEQKQEEEQQEVTEGEAEASESGAEAETGEGAAETAGDGTETTEATAEAGEQQTESAEDSAQTAEAADAPSATDDQTSEDKTEEKAEEQQQEIVDAAGDETAEQGQKPADAEEKKDDEADKKAEEPKTE